MKAIAAPRFGGPEVLTALEVPDPVAGLGDVVIEVASAGVGMWDLLLVAGLLDPALPLPFVPGLEAAGRVVATGADVDAFRPGDDVFGFGAPGSSAFAPFARFPASALAHRPATLDALTAGGVPVAAMTAHQALHDDLTLAAGETLLVVGGTGGVGSFAVQLGRLAHAHVIAVVRARDAAAATALGADRVVAHDAEDLVAAVREAAPFGVDAVLDTTGALYDAALATLRAGGRIADLTPQRPKATRNDVRALPIAARPDGTRLVTIAALFDTGKLRFAVAEALPAARAGDALRALAASTARGKYVLVP